MKNKPKREWTLRTPEKPGKYWVLSSNRKLRLVSVYKRPEFGIWYIKRGGVEDPLEYFEAHNPGALWCKALIPPRPKAKELVLEPHLCPVCGNKPVWAEDKYNSDWTYLTCFSGNHKLHTPSYRQAGNNDFYKDVVTAWNKIVSQTDKWSETTPKKDGLYWLFMSGGDSSPFLVYFEESLHRFYLRDIENIPQASLNKKGCYNVQRR